MATAARPRTAGLEEWLLAVAVLANVAVALAVRHFPYQDIVNHLARYVLLDRVLSGDVPAWLDASRASASRRCPAASSAAPSPSMAACRMRSW